MMRCLFDLDNPILARAAWSRIAEGGDRAAAALIKAVGPSAALRWLFAQSTGASAAAGARALNAAAAEHRCAPNDSEGGRAPAQAGYRAEARGANPPGHGSGPGWARSAGVGEAVWGAGGIVQGVEDGGRGRARSAGGGEA
ncbi:MAG: hypothetical protein LBE08_13490, partial [Bifidobacteriaceae bacterium]|nr:hypothetical protein [Bifidobacteriaceae bacterium]